MIESNTFYGLNMAKEIDLSNNSISLIKQNAFNNSYPKLLKISIKNISFENICNLITSFQSSFQILKSFTDIEYYNSIFIENREDIDCSKSFYFIKQKLFYNFLNEYDTVDFLRNCDQKFYLKNQFNC